MEAIFKRVFYGWVETKGLVKLKGKAKDVWTAKKRVNGQSADTNIVAGQVVKSSQDLL